MSGDTKLDLLQLDQISASLKRALLDDDAGGPFRTAPASPTNPLATLADTVAAGTLEYYSATNGVFALTSSPTIVTGTPVSLASAGTYFGLYVADWVSLSVQAGFGTAVTAQLYLNSVAIPISSMTSHCSSGGGGQVQNHVSAGVFVAASPGLTLDVRANKDANAGSSAQLQNGQLFVLRLS